MKSPRVNTLVLLWPKSVQQAGFSLIETMIVTVIISILVAVALPLFTGLVAQSRLNAAIFELSQQWKVTRYDAIGSGSTPYTLCMTENKNRVTYVKIKGNDCTAVTSWSSLPRGVAIEEENSTLRRVAGVAGGQGEIYRVSWADTRAGYGGSWGTVRAFNSGGWGLEEVFYFSLK